MTDPQVALFMLSSFVLVILLGFPICFTLIGMGVGFGYYYYYDAERMAEIGASLFDNQVFDLYGLHFGTRECYRSALL
jgi:TRAP-type mannitol/chloroaromatic compound transport system permease large subunit